MFFDIMPPRMRRSGRKGNGSLRSRSQPLKRRFRGTRSVTTDTSQNEAFASTSQQKLRGKRLIVQDPDSSFEYVILEFSSVFSELSSLVKCKECDSGIQFQTIKPRGLGFKLQMLCSQCEPKEIDSGPLVSNSYGINIRIVLAMRQIGVGYTGLSTFCSMMDLRSPRRVIYESASEKIAASAAKVAEFCMIKASREEVSRTRAARKFDDPRAVTVSIDGAWAKRGFSSLFGVVAAVGGESNKVLDNTVRSLYCAFCARWKSKEGTTEFEEAMEEHNSTCLVNHNGSSASMEASSAVELFERSIETRGLLYKNFVGDGDSKAHKAVVKSDPYGPNNPVIKKECVGHVCKRMGSRLRNLLKKNPSLKGRGKLTGGEITKLTLYYGKAIRSNPTDKEKMRRAIWATYHHRVSTDEEPSHHFCPEGESSWCLFQRAKSSGDENEYRHPPAWPEALSRALIPIYEDLSAENLLERCLGAHTQNNNESLHSTIWRLAPKARFCGRRTIETAVNIATCTFNEGQRSLLLIMSELGITVGCNSYGGVEGRDVLRVTEANRESSGEEARRGRAKKRNRSSSWSGEDSEYGPGIDSVW